MLCGDTEQTPINLEQILPPLLLDVLAQDGFSIFVSGGKEHGKTNCTMLLLELCHELGIRKHFATNIKTESYYIQQITNKPDLDAWLKKQHGLKTYAMDELGKNLRKFGFASKKNQDILDVIQLIRHFDCGFIGMAPAEKFVDSGFLIAKDILDVHIKKVSKTMAKVIDYYHNEVYFWRDIPATTICHDGKDIAKFDMEKPEDLTGAPLCCRVASYASKLPPDQASFSKIGKIFDLTAEQAKREIIKHLKHANHDSRTLVEVREVTETDLKPSNP